MHVQNMKLHPDDTSHNSQSLSLHMTKTAINL